MLRCLEERLLGRLGGTYRVVCGIIIPAHSQVHVGCRLHDLWNPALLFRALLQHGLLYGAVAIVWQWCFTVPELQMGDHKLGRLLCSGGSPTPHASRPMHRMNY